MINKKISDAASFLNQIMKIFGLFLLIPVAVLALYEDQALKFDWRQQFIGKVQDAIFVSVSKSKDILVARTQSNVLAALDTENGKIQWRQIFAEAENLLDMKLEGKILTSLSFDSSENATFVRSWNVLNGALIQEKRVQTSLGEFVPIHQGFLFQDMPHLVHITEHNGLKIHQIKGDLEAKIHSFSSGAKDDKDGFSCLTLKDSLVCASALLGSVYSTKLPLSGNTMNMASLSALGVNETPKNNLKIRKLKDNQISVSLSSGSSAILNFKEGKFSSINTLKPQKLGSNLLTVQCMNSEDLILIEQNCENLQNCDKTATLTRGKNQQNYDSGSERGIILDSWAFCQDSEAFQLILSHKDGSLVSVTPLGNIMWQREEALASITSVKLISKFSSFDDYEDTETDKSVWEMFLKRLKHHLAQIEMFLEKFKLNGLSSIILGGNSDSSYDSFGLRKMIVALTSQGTLYGIDSKSGKVLWQKLTSCESNENWILLQKGTKEPLAALICQENLIQFNPLNGKLINSRQFNGKIIKALLLHHTTEDHIRPILLQTENHGFELEPKEANLKAISGKVYVATIDADQMGIHGYRILFEENGAISKIPVWSFASPAAKIVHLKAKPTEEVVHSQGRVMADRSVLFKYINPNLAFVIAEGQNFINIYLLDLVTGRIIFSANHKRVQGPYHAVHSENWVIYTYFNEKSRRAELGSLELFEGKTQSNATVFSSLHNNISPLVERQAYILGPAYVTALKDTLTEKGITTKNLLMASSSGSVFNVPRHFLDPRRPSINTPPEMREPGLPPYVPELVFPPDVVLNYNQTLTRIKGITTAETGLESTSVVLVHGLDLYCTRVNPSKGFDLLKDDFEHYVIASVLLGLISAAYVTRKLSQRKMLMSAWK